MDKLYKLNVSIDSKGTNRSFFVSFDIIKQTDKQIKIKIDDRTNRIISISDLNKILWNNDSRTMWFLEEELPHLKNHMYDLCKSLLNSLGDSYIHALEKYNAFLEFDGTIPELEHVTDER